MSNGEKQKEKSGLRNTLIVVGVSFILTTIGGGSLGNYFQARSWKNQYTANLLESERARATEFFDELSRLMDKRLYRMRLLMERLTGGANAGPYWDSYREVLHEWNNSLNRNITMVDRYFGEDMRQIFYQDIHGNLRRVGATIGRESSDESQDSGSIDPRSLLDSTNVVICEFDSRMIRAIQEGNVGHFLHRVE